MPLLFFEKTYQSAITRRSDNHLEGSIKWRGQLQGSVAGPGYNALGNENEFELFQSPLVPVPHYTPHPSGLPNLLARSLSWTRPEGNFNTEVWDCDIAYSTVWDVREDVSHPILRPPRIKHTTKRNVKNTNWNFDGSLIQSTSGSLKSVPSERPLHRYTITMNYPFLPEALTYLSYVVNTDWVMITQDLRGTLIEQQQRGIIWPPGTLMLEHVHAPDSIHREMWQPAQATPPVEVIYFPVTFTLLGDPDGHDKVKPNTSFIENVYTRSDGKYLVDPSDYSTDEQPPNSSDDNRNGRNPRYLPHKIFKRRIRIAGEYPAEEQSLDDFGRYVNLDLAYQDLGTASWVPGNNITLNDFVMDYTWQGRAVVVEEAGMAGRPFLSRVDQLVLPTGQKQTNQIQLQPTPKREFTDARIFTAGATAIRARPQQSLPFLGTVPGLIEPPGP